MANPLTIRINQIEDLVGTTLDNVLLSNVATSNAGALVNHSANLNFNPTGTINVAVTANGTQSNVAFSVNASAVGGGSNVVSTFANGTIIVAHAKINFNNTASI